MDNYKSHLKTLFAVLFFCLSVFYLKAENGYDLWLRYTPVQNQQLLDEYKNEISGIIVLGESPTMEVVRSEIQNGLNSLLKTKVAFSTYYLNDPGLLIGSFDKLSGIAEVKAMVDNHDIDDEGYLIKKVNIGEKSNIVITSKTDVGVLYGVFAFLRNLQNQQPIKDIDITSRPKVKHRLLNHWDNLDRTVERGYSGASIWDWHKLPGFTDQRYVDYARANASIGINGTVLTNVNANALVLTPHYLEKIAALADVFGPYGIKVYLTARFSAPIQLGGLKTADPLDPAVIKWWKNKVDEIYSYVPDFGGFLVKANSEGQPGPQEYGRDHADGANLLAGALEPHGGIVMWRAFVYDFQVKEDRAKQAYTEFVPLDNKFHDNVLIQVKNGPIDFQPREPFHPLFGATKNTPLMMEFQITQEYLGQGTQLVYLAPMYKECLDADTYVKGEGSEVAKVIDGSLFGFHETGMAGVSNIGSDINWTGHHFGQANWYAFGRLAWDYNLSSEQIATEWINMTFTANETFVKPVLDIMLRSRETCVNYMTPLGLHHIMGWDHHYGPGPWVNIGRPDWTSIYYHQADEEGIGFDRTKTGSNALEQYAKPFQKLIEDPKTCPEEYLLWFHHLSWDFITNSGRTLWEEIVFRYNQGVDDVRKMQHQWDDLEGLIDDERFRHIKMLLAVQEQEAVWWRDACLSYFSLVNKRPIPEGYEKPKHDLEYYKKLEFPYAPGI